MKILFVTTHNLATNPRLYKEIVLAKQQGFVVEVICFEFNNWSRDLNAQLKRELGAIKIFSIPAGKENLSVWFTSIFGETLFRMAGRVFPLPLAATSQAVSRRSNLLIKALTKVNPPDIVIGHNPGAMWPVIVAAKKFNCKAGFDVEDYHPGEGNNSFSQAMVKKLMQMVLPKMDYVSFAAPLIMQQVMDDTGNVCAGKKWFTVLNYFPAKEFVQPETIKQGILKAVWFSQNINAGRGLEVVLPAVKELNGLMELHLIGKLDGAFFDAHLKDIPNIIIHPPMPQQQLHSSLAAFDIGLALDIPVDENRNLAITNKMIAYLQAGLYLVATNTPAQEQLLETFPRHGECLHHSGNDAVQVLEEIVLNIDKIRNGHKQRYLNFKNNNWENASIELLKTWRN